MGAPGFALGVNTANQAAQRQFQQQEEQRVAARNNYVDLQKNVLNNPNLDPNDPALNDIKDPVAKQAEIDRRVAERSKATNNIAGAFQPHESGSLFKVLSGLIHGAPAPPNTATAIASQPVSTAAPTAPETNGPQVPDAAAAPVVKDALGIPISDPTVAAAHQQPMHPMATSHPILDRFQEGLDALGNHLKGASIGANPPQHVNDVSNLAAGYESPTTIARESIAQRAQQAQELANTKGQYGLSAAEIRGGAVRGVAGHPLALASAQNLADSGEIFIDKSTGKPIDLDQIEQAVPGAMLTPYYQGARLLGYEVADQNGRVITADNQKKVVGLGGNVLPGASPLGAATVPRDVASRSTDQYGNVTTTQRRTAPETPTQPVSALAPTAPNVIPSAPDLAAINAGIQANKGKAGAPSRKAAVAAPISANAPQPPVTSPLALDANGQIPASAGGNPQVREFAQQLIDDRDVDKIPAKAKAAAALLARQYGWQQGTFTPKENVLLRESANFINEASSNPSLAVLDSPLSRLKLAQVISASDKEGALGKLATIATTAAENPQEAEFIRMYNQLVGTISGLSSLTRSGRATEQTINRLVKELPNPLTTTSSDDARKRLTRLNQELTVAQQKGSFATPVAQGKSKGTVSLANARNLPQYKGKSDAIIRADAEKLGYAVTP